MSHFILVSFCLAFLQLIGNANAQINLGDQGLLEGDIVPSKNRNAILSSKRWPNGVIPYEWATTATWGSNTPNWGPKHKDTLSKVMREIEEHTCLKFVPRTNQVDYVKIINSSRSSGCFSSVGRDGGMQELSLGDTDCCGSCWDYGTVTHEVFHAIGLWHEQSRYDRDNYITVNLDNVQESVRYNFEIKYQNESYTYDVPYNYYSIMHYQRNVFSKNGENTMITKDPDMMDVIGKQKQAHEDDYEKIRRIYECNGAYPTMPPSPDSICEDKITYCNQMLDKCGKESWTKTSCKKSCGFCKAGDTCKDTISYCYQQRNKCGEAWTKDYCKRTCRYC